MRFSRRQEPVEPVLSTPEQPGKGRPTPTRKEAEAARKQSLRVPTDPKAARKAARRRAAQERQESREALLAGDEARLPARDRGPVRGFVRDFVDGRWAAAELFLPLALVVLVLGLFRVPELQGIVSLVWMVSVIFIIVDTTVVLTRMNRELARRWPDQQDRKGATFYGLARLMQLRRLRLPPPRVRRGGKPVVPKAARK